MEKLQAVSTFLDNYWVRSQVFRTVQFSSAMLSGLFEKHRPELADKLLTVSASISNMRVMLRMLDDLPTLAHVLSSWKQSQDVMEKLGNLINCVCTQVYYPVEHFAWAADLKLLPMNSTPIWTMAIVLWALPLLVSLIRTTTQLLRHAVGDHSKHPTSSPREGREDLALQKLKREKFMLQLDLLQFVCDLIMAVFWMPAGFLWGGKLPASCWGLLGTISSLIGLYKTSCQRMN